MSRSHPPSLRAMVERLARDEALFGRGDVVLVACSGGPDSTALLHVLALLQKRLGHRVIAHGVDHGLRPEASAELASAREVAERLGVPFAITRVEVAKGGNLQARARAARLAALAEAATRAGAKVIATGHTADDRAETVLLRLLRGAGPRGLAVLPPIAPLPFGDDDDDDPPEPAPSPETASSAPHLVRPLLRARRADVLAHLRRHDLPFATDPSNADPRFTRVRVRRELVPLLEDLAPRIIEHLCALADMLAADEGPAAGAESALASLGRAQRQEVERARRLGRRALQLRLQGGRDVEVAFPNERIVLREKR